MQVGIVGHGAVGMHDGQEGLGLFGQVFAGQLFVGHAKFFSREEVISMLSFNIPTALFAAKI
jgi:hypothetical protein